ncbi:MAG: hypothetical protein V4558_02160 [Gemmatimonadota bacterium]
MADLDREDVRSLLRSCVPSTDALEVFILLSSSPDRVWSLQEVRAAMQGTTVAQPTVVGFLDALRSCGLAVGDPATGFQYLPSTPELAIAAEHIVRAYNERPVTLIRTIYAIADAKALDTFANAFRIRKP